MLSKLAETRKRKVGRIEVGGGVFLVGSIQNEKFRVRWCVLAVQDSEALMRIVHDLRCAIGSSEMYHLLK